MNAIPKSGASPFRSTVKASNPPAEAPIPTIGNPRSTGFSAFVTFDLGETFAVFLFAFFDVAICRDALTKVFQSRSESYVVSYGNRIISGRLHGTLPGQSGAVFHQAMEGNPKVAQQLFLLGSQITRCLDLCSYDLEHLHVQRFS